MIKKYFFLVAIVFTTFDLFCQWNSLGYGLNNYVRSIEFDSSNNILYAGGNFTYSNSLKLDQIAQWNGSNWDSMDTGGNGNPTYAMTIFDGKLFASTLFSYTFPNNLHCLAFWNGTTWEWDTLNQKVNSSVRVFHEYNNELYLGGAFTKIGAMDVNRIAKYDGINFTAYSFPVNGGTVDAIEFYQGQMYVGGNFYDSITGINDLERWNGTAFESFGSGGLSFGVDMVNTMAVYNNELYIGGNFTIGAGDPANYIMRWDGSQFRDVGGGTDGVVHKLKVYNGELYASGSFHNIGSLTVDCLAKWNGVLWSEVCPFTLSNAQNNCVITDFCVVNNDLYIAGYFDYVDTIQMNNIAKYSGLNQSVESEPNSIFKLYPVPASNKIVIEFMDSKIISFKIIDSSGKLLNSLPKLTTKTEIDISKLASGIYFVEAITEQGTLRKKFVKN